VSQAELPDEERYAVEYDISYGETVAGTLSRSNEQDVWGFEAEAGDIITITLKAARRRGRRKARFCANGPSWVCRPCRV